MLARHPDLVNTLRFSHPGVEPRPLVPIKREGESPSGRQGTCVNATANLESSPVPFLAFPPPPVARPRHASLTRCAEEQVEAPIAEPARSPLRPRLLVLTDIGGDPDDQQSLVRLLLYANEFEIEGLVASASGTLGELKERVTRPDLIREIVTAYGQVRENLGRHATGYPKAAELLSKVKSGNPQRGLAAVGEGHDTEGSRWIIAAADRDDERPLNITIWGGQTDLAQALWRVRQDRGPLGLARFVRRIRVYDISDQDEIGSWMLREFPGLFYVLAKSLPGQDKRSGTYRGMYLGGDESLTSRQWLDEHVRRGHGPLGSLYPNRTWTEPNPHGALKEGDTPSWFYFLPHGLNDPAHPEWGGWGARFLRKGDGVYPETTFRDAGDLWNGKADPRSAVWRWRPAYQAEFQARMDWCVADRFEKANHAPRAVVNGDLTRAVLPIEARSGTEVRLSASGSIDPDGHPLKFKWSVYPEAGTYRGEVALTGGDKDRVTFKAPTVTERQTIHVLVELMDGGVPALTSYRRAVITVRP